MDVPAHQLSARSNMDVAGVADRLSAIEAEIQHLYEHVPFGSHALDAQGTYLYINSLELSWLGYCREEIVGIRKFRDFLTADSQQLLSRHLHVIDRSTPIGDLELELVRRNGTTMPITLNSVGYFDAGGKLLKQRAVMFDLRESRQAKIRDLVASAAFESVSGMIITDSQQVIQQVNAAFTVLTGYSAQEAIGQTPHLLSSGSHDAAFFRAMWAALKENGHWQGEIWNRRKDGTALTEWLSITAVVDQQGAVIRYIGSFYDVTASKTAEAELLQLAYFDPLTKLPNRRLLLDRLTQALTLLPRGGLRGAVLFVDLDHFKTINDTRGHATGDLLLVESGRRLRDAVRAGDTVAHIGGDEFVVVLEGLDDQTLQCAEQSKIVADNILSALAQPYLFDGLELHCSASIGIALFADMTSAVDLIQQADLAMYQAKVAGRNGMSFFNTEMQAQVTARAALEGSLRHGLERHQFKLFFQPQVNQQGQILSAEVLLRWQHPEHGLVAPGQFIALAEETGLIVPIGQWVLETACNQLKAWETTPLARNLQLAVNVSARQYQQDDFLSSVQQVLSASAIDPTKLLLEITESMMLNVPDAIGKMNALKKLGIGFSMDDFGTGYSSLASLMLLPLTELKIDQSFVSKLGVNASGAIIVRATIALGQALGLEVIAEGVETQEQLDMLVRNGCLRFQGYFFSRPVPIEQFDALLKRAV